MERETEIRKIFREGGVDNAPEGFTAGVMEKINTLPERGSHRPLIRPAIWIVFLVTSAGIVLLSFLAKPREIGLLDRFGLEWDLQWEIPQLSFQLDSLSGSPVVSLILSVLAALLLLLVFDRLISRRRFMH